MYAFEWMWTDSEHHTLVLFNGYVPIACMLFRNPDDFWQGIALIDQPGAMDGPLHEDTK